MSIDKAQQALLKGNLQLTDLITRQILMQEPEHPQALQVRKALVAAVGQPQWHADDQHFLLIKAWGFGFWSDLDHVLGSLLLAELTGRTPVVHWGPNSLFRDPDTPNAFEHYFQPVSSTTLANLMAPGTSYYPPKWNAGNLQVEELDKWSGPGSRMTGLYFLRRPEHVVVSDFHIKVNDLMPWIPEGSEWHGMSRQAIYRRLVSRYIRLQPARQQAIDAVWQRLFEGHQWLAVHVRGTDKALELTQLSEVNRAYHRSIDRILSVNPDLKIFLLTDSTETVSEFQGLWGDRITCLDALRGQGLQGVHLSGHPGLLMGEQVLTDAFLAARCDMFLGNGASNVSTGIRHLKDWPAGSFFLLGADFLDQLDTSLHDW